MCIFRSILGRREEKVQIPIPLEVLRKGGATSSEAIINRFGSNEEFVKISKHTTEEIIKRDNDDAEKLAKVSPI